MASAVSARKRTAAGAAITHQIWQATCAHLLADDPTIGEATRNALVESTLIHLRSLIGFLLADSPGPPKPLKSDVRPSWFRGGELWIPGGKRHRKALYSFHEAVSRTAAHAVVTTVVHPGSWPIPEALLVVGEDLGTFTRTLPPEEQDRFTSDGNRIRTALAAIEAMQIANYPPGTASLPVRRARKLLRTQLKWTEDRQG